MSSRTTQNFITTNWQINKHQHTSKHVRFRERKKFKVQIDQSADVYIFAPVRKTVALTSMMHKMQNFTRKEHLPLWHKGSDNNSLNIEKKISLTHISTHQDTSICEEASIPVKKITVHFKAYADMILQSTFRQTVVVTSRRINFLLVATRCSKTKFLESLLTAILNYGGHTENCFLREWSWTINF